MKEIKLEGKNPFLVEVSNDGEPTVQHAAKWAIELGTRCRVHLNVWKSNFAEQAPRSVQNAIHKMENALILLVGWYHKILQEKDENSDEQF